MTGRHATKGCAFIREHGVRGDHHRADPLLLDGYKDLLELAFIARVQHGVEITAIGDDLTAGPASRRSRGRGR